MPVLQFDLPNRTVDALCGTYGYQANIPNNGSTIPNPETKNQYAKRVVAEYLIKLTRSWEANRDARTAIAAADANSSGITIT